MFYCQPEIDPFGSCLNYQVPNHDTDKNAVAIDAFSISWSNLNFPQFNL